MKKYLFFLLLFFSVGKLATGQDLPDDPEAVKKLDSLVRELWTPAQRLPMRPFHSVITPDATAFNGLVNIYKVRDSFFLEVPDSVLRLPIMEMTQLVKTAPNSGYPGQMGREDCIYFDAGRDSLLYIGRIGTKVGAEPGSRMEKALKDASANDVLLDLPLVAFGEGGHSYVVDATDLFTKPNAVFSNTGTDNVHVDAIKTYPQNIELVISSVGDEQMASAMSYSFVALSKVPMPERLYDPRIGYFPGRKSDYFSDTQQRVDNRESIARWRMEPRPEDMEKWKRGEMVEAAKPIVYYIDPNTPKQWVKYLIAGVNDWQKAFEQAGFKNAIMAKEWPEGTPYDLHDSRFSFLCYLPSETPNAMGPHISDPRSGEIIQTHVNWFHNVMVILNGWYKTQASALDPAARKAKLDDELMGQLIRFVSSHEVGHTLGLAHNHGSSSQSPVEKLRDSAWLRIHGHTASIMDYARFNYVAQPEDHIPEEELWPHIGEYDRWAIQWGYKYTGLTDPQSDKLVVSGWATDSLASNPMLWFGSEEQDVSQIPFAGYLPADPRVQTECVGDDNMIGNAYGLKNFRRVMASFPDWDHTENGVYEDWGQVYGWMKWTLKNHWLPQVEAYIGGRSRTFKSEEAAGDVYAPTPVSQQKSAVRWLNDHVFTTPEWLMDPRVVNKITDPKNINFVGELQQDAVRKLLDVNTLFRLTANANQFGADSTYSLDEYFNDLHGSIWGVISSRQPMDFYRRNMQRTYVNSLAPIVATYNGQVKESELWMAARKDLLRIYREVKTALPGYTGADLDHLETVKWRIEKILKIKPLFN